MTQRSSSPARPRRTVSRLFVGALAAISFGTAASIDPPPASAQPAAALGRPLPDGSMAAGSVSVRVVAGSPASKVVGADVTLIVGGVPRIARTDASGRAVFPGLTAGTTVQAKIKDAEGKEVTSDAFPVPSSGGARVMLTTKPFTGNAGPTTGAPMDRMPEAKEMSGQPRPDRNTPAGSYVVRLTYNNLQPSAAGPRDANPPVGETVTLVGYAADDSVVVERAKLDGEGHATFTDLDPTGNIGYFALATLPRGAGVDRMFSQPIQLDGQAGVRTILSGDKRDAKTPNLDQLVTRQSIATPVGKVRVTLETIEGIALPNATIRLIDASTKTVVGEAGASVLRSDPTTVQGGSKFESKPDLPAGVIEVVVHGGADQDLPIADIPVSVGAADATTLDGTPSKTASDGTVRLTAPTVSAGTHQRAVFRVLGRDFVSEPFDVTKSGGKLDVRAQWASEGRPQAVFDVPFKPDQVLFAETSITPGTATLAGSYRSMPFLAIPQAGTHVGIVIIPRVTLVFNMRAMIEDQLLAVQGRWTIENNSWAPYRATPDGLMIPLPKGHKGGVVAEASQNDVAVVPGEGLRVIRPLPPGSGISFIAGFSMTADNGNVDWSLDLPLGSGTISSGRLVGSDIHIRETPGMTVTLPNNVRGAVKPGKDGSKYYMIEGITIPKGRSIEMTIHGLPAPASWKLWVPRAVGVLVVLTIVGGVALALLGKRAPVSTSAARRAALLDELVELERAGAVATGPGDRGSDPGRREQIMAELEKLWGS